MNESPESTDLSLDDIGAKQERELKNIALLSIRSRIDGKEQNIAVSDPILRKKAGVFVTIKRFGQLRGCIGFIFPYYELWDATAKAASSAAASDPRFMPIDTSELRTLEIEISVLGGMVKIDPEKSEEINKLEIGREGLMVAGFGTSGVLLPQVATEFSFNALEFLEATCEKAGLPRDAWKNPDVSVYKFAAKIF